jgi:uncharacterized protein (UPF0332 family)
MTQQWDKESRDALIAYRMKRADETMQEADLMIKESLYHGAINRLYYACYYATVAILLKNGIQAQTHAGVKTMLGLHFVSKGLIPIEIGRILTTLFERRQTGDYDDFVLCDQSEVVELREKAVAYIDCMKSLLSDTEEQ